MIELTSEDPVWDPTSSEFSEQETYDMNYIGKFITHEATSRGQLVINSVGTCDASDITDDTNFGLGLENDVTVSRVRVSNSIAKPKVYYLTLRKKWGISPDIANKTLHATTQVGIRTVFHLSLSQIFRTNDQALRYRRLTHNVL